MKEIPILFSTPMVQALLDGRKTMTRRVIKIDDIVAHPDRFYYVGNSNTKEVPRPAIKYDERVWHEFGLKNNNGPSWVDTCPYGKPGDILYVRENWKLVGWSFEDGTTNIEFTDGTIETFDTPDNDDDIGYNWLVKQFEQLVAK